METTATSNMHKNLVKFGPVVSEMYASGETDTSHRPTHAMGEIRKTKVSDAPLT